MASPESAAPDPATASRAEVPARMSQGEELEEGLPEWSCRSEGDAYSRLPLTDRGSAVGIFHFRTFSYTFLHTLGGVLGDFGVREHRNAQAVEGKHTEPEPACSVRAALNRPGSGAEIGTPTQQGAVA